MVELMPGPARSLGLLAAIAAAIALSLLAPRPSDAQSGIICSRTGGGSPYNFQTWEDDRNRSLYLDALSLAAANQLLPDHDDFHIPDLKVGAGRTEDPSAVIPAHLLYGIAWVESKINQTELETNYGESGPALVSSDCGYGIMQITTGFDNDNMPPTNWETLVGAHYAYNIAAGARILADKWNDALFPRVGARDPRFIESWYYAVWAYNGWALANHPAGPSADPFRSLPYRCDERRNGYPYQELVFGCIVNPPSPEDRQLWQPFPVALPNLANLAWSGGPLDQNQFLNGWTEIRSSYDSGTGGAFASMSYDLPSAAVPYQDSSPALGQPEAARERVLGVPVLSVNEDSIELSSVSGSSRRGLLLIGNSGTGLLPWRVKAAPSWLSFDLDGGAALGSDPAWSAAQSARGSRLSFRADAEGQREGPNRGDIVIEAMLPDGNVETHRVTVDLDKIGAAFYEAGTPES